MPRGEMSEIEKRALERLGAAGTGGLSTMAVAAALWGWSKGSRRARAAGAILARLQGRGLVRAGLMNGGAQRWWLVRGGETEAERGTGRIFEGEG